jgi:hypothetical protein
MVKWPQLLRALSDKEKHAFHVEGLRAKTFDSVVPRLRARAADPHAPQPRDPTPETFHQVAKVFSGR